MNRILLLLIVLALLCVPALSALAAGTPQPGDPALPAANTTRTTGSPWLGVLVLVFAGGIYMYVRSLQPPDTIITSCCAPLIDEAKEARIEAARLRVDVDENK